MSLDLCPSEVERSLIKHDSVKIHPLYPMAKVLYHPEFEQFFKSYFQSWAMTENMIHSVREVYKFKQFLEEEHHKIDNDYQLWGFIAEYTDTTQKRKVMTSWMVNILDACDKRDLEHKGKELVHRHPDKRNVFNTLAHPEFHTFFKRYFASQECDKEMVMFILTMLNLKKRFQLSTPDDVTRCMIVMIHNVNYRKIMTHFMSAWIEKTKSENQFEIDDAFKNVLIK